MLKHEYQANSGKPACTGRRIANSEKGFSLLELLITLVIFGILMVTTTSIILLNLKAARRIKARSYVREETSFMLNVLKKDIRNAERIKCYSAGAYGNCSVSGMTSYESIEVTVIGMDGNSHNYQWKLNSGQVKRLENGTTMTYATPSDIEFNSVAGFGFEVECLGTGDVNNCIVKILTKARTNGMPDGQWTTKILASSTRNFNF